MLKRYWGYVNLALRLQIFRESLQGMSKEQCDCVALCEVYPVCMHNVIILVFHVFICMSISVLLQIVCKNN